MYMAELFESRRGECLLESCLNGEYDRFIADYTKGDRFFLPILD